MISSLPSSATPPPSPHEIPAEAIALLDFARAAAVEHGFGNLNGTGKVDQDQPVFLWITGRMTHCFALGALLGVDGCSALAAHGVRALLSGPLRDTEFGGWHSAVEHDGSAVDGRKEAYAHSFVTLAASSASVAGVEGARELLDLALANQTERWWDDDAGMVVEEYDRTFGTLDPYRGANANMHTVEAYLNAADVSGDDVWLERATRITERIVKSARAFDWRLPEHYNPMWSPLLDYNRDQPAHPFRPYGSTIGHWLEWSRLICHVVAERTARGLEIPADFGDASRIWYDRAVSEGWNVDGAPGFVYTVDFDASPVVRQRMHWVLCEAIGAADALLKVHGDERYRADLATYWEYADRYLIERPGQWTHELGADNSRGAGTWSGKPDIYHAFQAVLLPHLPASPTFAPAIANGGFQP